MYTDVTIWTFQCTPKLLSAHINVHITWYLHQSCPITHQVNTSTNLPTKNYFRFKKWPIRTLDLYKSAYRPTVPTMPSSATKIWNEQVYILLAQVIVLIHTCYACASEINQCEFQTSYNGNLYFQAARPQKCPPTRVSCYFDISCSLFIRFTNRFTQLIS